MNFTAENSLKDTCTVLISEKKSATFNLKNGGKYRATVKEVSGHAVLLTQPSGMEFSDVYLPLAEISSIEVQVRN